MPRPVLWTSVRYSPSPVVNVQSHVVVLEVSGLKHFANALLGVWYDADADASAESLAKAVGRACHVWGWQASTGGEAGDELAL